MELSSLFVRARFFYECSPYYWNGGLRYIIILIQLLNPHPCKCALIGRGSGCTLTIGAAGCTPTSGAAKCTPTVGAAGCTLTVGAAKHGLV